MGTVLLDTSHIAVCHLIGGFRIQAAVYGRLGTLGDQDNGGVFQLAQGC